MFPFRIHDHDRFWIALRDDFEVVHMQFASEMPIAEMQQKTFFHPRRGGVWMEPNR